MRTNDDCRICALEAKILGIKPINHKMPVITGNDSGSVALLLKSPNNE